MHPILSLENIYYSYHNLKGETPAIENMSFQVAEGEFLAIVGPSGCGNAMVKIWKFWKRCQVNLLQHVRQESPVRITHRAVYMYVGKFTIPNNFFYD